MGVSGSRNDRRSPDRGVSPVVGVVLLLALVIALAAVVVAMLSGAGDLLVEPAPMIRFEADYDHTGTGNDGNGPYVNITHAGGDIGNGDEIVITDDSGNSVRWSDVWTAGPIAEAGEYVHIDGAGSDAALDPICEAGQTYRVIDRRPERSLTILEFEVPRDPDPMPSWC